MAAMVSTFCTTLALIYIFSFWQSSNVLSLLFPRWEIQLEIVIASFMVMALPLCVCRVVALLPFFFPNLWLFTKWQFWLPNFNLIFLCGSRYYKKSARKSPEVEMSLSSSNLRSPYDVLLWYFSLFSMFHHDQQMENGHWS